MSRKYQVYWSQIDEDFNSEQEKKIRSDFKIELLSPVGNTVEERRLIHAIIKDSVLEDFLAWLEEEEFEHKVISVTAKDGTPYGYQVVYTYDDDGNDNVTYEKLPDYEDEEGNVVEQATYECEDDTDFFQEASSTDEEGNTITIKSSKHTFASWS